MMKLGNHSLAVKLSANGVYTHPVYVGRQEKEYNDVIYLWSGNRIDIRIV